MRNQKSVEEEKEFLNKIMTKYKDKLSRPFDHTTQEMLLGFNKNENIFKERELEDEVMLELSVQEKKMSIYYKELLEQGVKIERLIEDQLDSVGNFEELIDKRLEFMASDLLNEEIFYQDMGMGSDFKYTKKVDDLKKELGKSAGDDIDKIIKSIGGDTYYKTNAERTLRSNGISEGDSNKLPNIGLENRGEGVDIDATKKIIDIKMGEIKKIAMNNRKYDAKNNKKYILSKKM